MKTLRDAGSLEGKRVVLRLDLNVPIENGEVRDAYRIESSLSTLDYLIKQGARIIIISHIGKGKSDDTLRPVVQYLRGRYDIRFFPNLMSPDNKLSIEKLQNGEIAMLENLRHSKGEEENSDDFARYLGSLGEVYVNDAFAVSHRAHASVVGITKYLPGYAGFLLEKEVNALSAAFHPEHPFLFILGGAKVSTKIPLLKKFAETADHVLVGGANANNFLKAKGYEVGASLIDVDALSGLDEYLHNPRVLLPIDVVVKDGGVTKNADEVGATDMIVDLGSETIKQLTAIVAEARLVIWNGPLGLYEEGFTAGSKQLVELLVASQAKTIVGGGDTVALIDAMGVHEKFSFVSTGGGAMLDFLANETLPGISALE
jgi:phosphoglycerate kinase